MSLWFPYGEHDALAANSAAAPRALCVPEGALAFKQSPKLQVGTAQGTPPSEARVAARLTITSLNRKCAGELSTGTGFLTVTDRQCVAEVLQ